MPRFRIAWNDFYNTQKPTPIEKQTYTSKLSPSSESVYVSNCLFTSIVSTDNGGALFCSASVAYLLVESSFFYSCSTSNGLGGAIFFSNTNNGQSVLYEVCGNGCSSSSSGLFSAIIVKDSILNKNDVNYSSIVRCMTENSNLLSILYFDYGKNCFPSVNISMNKCGKASALYCYPRPDPSSVTCSFTYSTLADNIYISFICIYLDRNNVNYEFKCCNVIRNTKISDSEGLIRSDGNIVFKDSCILANTANYIFYADSTSYTVTLSNCTIDKTTCYQTLIIQNTVIKSFIHALNHLSTRNCYAEYDSAGTLTPITPPIIQSPSPSKKQKLYYSCDRLFHRYRLSDVVLLTNLLILSFIHPCASTNPFY
jgi:hypothetical protein